MFTQSTFITKEEILEGKFDVLGWVNIKVSKYGMIPYIVLNDTASGEIRKMLKFYSVEASNSLITLKNNQIRISNQEINVSLYDRVMLKDKLFGLQKMVNIKGQFYL